MTICNTRILGTLLIIVGLISLGIAGAFIYQGFDKGNLIIESMKAEQVEYGAADSTITGIIDTPQEAQVMASILRQHRVENYGYYSKLDRTDPNRDQILKAITMETSLNLAQLGYGLTDVIKATGAYIGLLGITLCVSGVFLARSRKSPLS